MKSRTLPKNVIFAKSLSTPPYNNLNEIVLLCSYSSYDNTSLPKYCLPKYVCTESIGKL